MDVKHGAQLLTNFTTIDVQTNAEISVHSKEMKVEGTINFCPVPDRDGGSDMPRQLYSI